MRIQAVVRNSSSDVVLHRLEEGTFRLTKGPNWRDTAEFVAITENPLSIAIGCPIDIYDEADNKMFSGIVWDIRMRRVFKDWWRVEVFCQGWEIVPYKRTICGNWTNKRTSEIVAELVSTYLSQEGISLHESEVVQGTQLASYSTGNAKSIGAVLDELAELDGVSWYIDHNKVLHYWQPELFVPTYMDSQVMILELNGCMNFEDYANKIFVYYGEDGKVVAQDDTEIQLRQTIEGYGTGIYPYVFDAGNVSQEEANSIAQRLLDMKASLRPQINIQIAGRYERCILTISTGPLMGNYYLSEVVWQSTGDAWITSARGKLVASPPVPVHDRVRELALMLTKGMNQIVASTNLQLSPDSNKDLQGIKVVRTDRDANGRFVKVYYYRKDGTLLMQSQLEGLSPDYRYRNEYWYDATGQNIVLYRRFERFYDELHNLTEERLISETQGGGS